jgi:NADH:ubiquinone oxidoreductase subunit F (NADH-binding)
MTWWMAGAGSETDLELISSLGDTMALSSKCGLGQAATTAFRTSLPLFEAEYKAHIRKTCPAGVCPMDISEECEACQR